jgi:GAF domain-containing protein
MDKNENYKLLLAQVRAIVKDESDPVANMANVAALIQETFHFWWTGFYRVIGEQLVLGPFQGPVACTRIGFGKGVCGTAWKEKKTLVVEDVEQFPGHIACSSESKSEIVVPLMKNSEVISVLDIDSERLATFDAIDREWLEQIAEVVAAVLGDSPAGNGVAFKQS